MLNLNDNIITERGALPLIDGLKDLPNLEELNLGDSIIRNEGALKLASVAPTSWPKLQLLNLSACEIELSGGLAIVNSLKIKKNLKSLDLNCNHFGENGVEEIKKNFTTNGVLDESVLMPIDDDQGEKSDDETDEAAGDMEKGTGAVKSEDYVNVNTLQSFLAKPTLVCLLIVKFLGIFKLLKCRNLFSKPECCYC